MSPPVHDKGETDRQRLKDEDILPLSEHMGD